MFDADDAVVHNWPGVHDGRPLQRAWDLMNAVAEGMPRHEFERELFGLCAQQFGWAREMLEHPVSIAGVHVHTLDAAGHAYAYADDEAALGRAYDRVGEYVEEIVAALGEDDDLLVVSDHGMRAAFYPPDTGEKPASHSWARVREFHDRDRSGVGVRRAAMGGGTRGGIRSERVRQRRGDRHADRPPARTRLPRLILCRWGVRNGYPGSKRTVHGP